ncbi:MAG: TetR/AcrR family transcriptional regulator [Solirubrobacteraceae bacterium]
MSDDYIDSPEYREQRQRERLCVAFVQAMADGGYETITIARVSELSGCSRETFHRHYEDLLDCYRDACSYSLQESRSATVAAWLAVHGWSERLRRACHALLTHVEEHPDAARAVLVAALSSGPEVADHVRETIAFHERALVMAFQLHPQGFVTSRLTPRALTGGMRHVLHLRMREGRERQIAELADDLHEWIECHHSTAAARLPLIAGGKMRGCSVAPPRPQEGVQAESILRDQDERLRVLDTVVRLMLQPGRETLDGATVARFAGISAVRFQADYGGVQTCATQVVDDFVCANNAALRTGAQQGKSWPESVRLAIVHSLAHIDANRELSRLTLLRLALVPEVCGVRHAALAECIVSVALDGAPEPLHARRLIADALPGTVNELLTWTIAAGAFARLPALADQIAFFLLAPHLGGERAAEKVIASADAEWLGRSVEPE